MKASYQTDGKNKVMKAMSSVRLYFPVFGASHSTTEMHWVGRKFCVKSSGRGEPKSIFLLY
jgi:hypothetical protein